MSVLIQLKHLIVTNLNPNLDQNIKAAMLNVINAIDSDLDDQGYDTSFETDEAIEALDAAILGLEYQTEREEELDNENKFSVSIPPRKPSIAPRDEEEDVTTS